ncbi:AAA family ATPase [Massilia sp. W12]|uniref:AAA family ATPase n=1 Tax=Massilia sp. W12 TaxID=3126507 RepID=UPI0030D42D86
MDKPQHDSAWRIFTGQGDSHLASLPDAPPWRTFQGQPSDPPAFCVSQAYAPDDEKWKRAKTYQTPACALDAINAALLLRRPLLVTGKPGAGKSSLAYRVAYELALGPVLVWPINSRSSLKEGLYDYDAIARLNDQRLDASQAEDIGAYLSLRALGTALLPIERPRVLLIDELDKADPDLPNDLLHVFEEGCFDIPELQRHASDNVEVKMMGEAKRVNINHGHVACKAFPFIVMTSNGERDFPPAFLRRCIRLELPDPDAEQLMAIVSAHLGEAVAQQAKQRIAEFAAQQGARTTATDQLLNALFIVHGVNGEKPGAAAAAELDALLTQALD